MWSEKLPIIQFDSSNVLCEHFHVPKARQVEFKASCINFRRELYMLGKTQAATNAEIHAKRNARILFVLDSVMILGFWGPPGSSFEDGIQTNFKKLPQGDLLGRLLLDMFA